MNYRLIIYILILAFIGCKQKKLTLSKIEGKRIEITTDLKLNDSIENYIAPFRNHITKDLDSVLTYSTNTYSKKDGELNAAIGNLMADIVKSQGNIIFKKRTNKTIDAVILNHGGIRAIIPKGAISSRTAYEVMPFENKIFVVALKGTIIEKGIDYIIKSKRAHPISGLEIVIDKNDVLISSKINGKNINPNHTYYIATSDFLYNGGDSMHFFQPNESFNDLDYKIRNAMIDYFKKTDTINPTIDSRFIRK